VISLVVHGHFYQPPRENPWTDELEREPSAAPAHDWNVRIHDECYRPNAFARIHGHRDRIRAVVNNYGRLSFNFGPTLARWIERHDPWTHRRIQAGDRDQVRRLGRGGAMAQVWGHPIAPLLSPIDRRTQILWGLQDFARRFGRPTEGMWLPETAADPATLEALIEAGVSFTILAPEQIAAVRQPHGTWSPVTRDTLDTGRAYRWMHRDGSGRSIAIAVFDGPMSREVAFGGSAGDAEAFLTGVERSAARTSAGAGGRRLVLIASDGELYGHHKKFADLTLAYALAVEADARDIAVTNLAAHLAAEPPTWEARLAEGPSGEGTAWSCGHGLGRWLRDCGCSMRAPEDGWSQAWRGPLRAGLDHLRDRTHALFEDLGAELLCDPWGARDAYGEVIDEPPATRRALLRSFAHGPLAAGDTQAAARALTLLETMRSALLMYASCGWFFDDIAGVESALVLRQAAFVLDGWEALGAAPPVDEVSDLLAAGRSNLPAGESGADVLRRVRGDRVTSVQVAAASLLGEALHSDALPVPTPGHEVRELGRAPRAQPHGRREVEVTQLRTGERTTFALPAAVLGEPLVRFADRTVALEDMPGALKRALVLRLVLGLAARAQLAPEDADRLLRASRLLRAGDVASPDPELDAAVQAALARLVASLDPAAAPEDAVAHLCHLVTDLRGALGEAERTVEEWVGERLEADAAAGREASPTLRELAESMGFGLD
jgi:alpha-amylase/alpha-mannosidase (GH57 family)